MARRRATTFGPLFEPPLFDVDAAASLVEVVVAVSLVVVVASAATVVDVVLAVELVVVVALAVVLVVGLAVVVVGFAVVVVELLVVVDEAAVTTTVPCMLLWIAQWYANVPGALKVCEKVSPVAR
jgi:hypothetical protein